MNKVTQSIYKNAVDNALFDKDGHFRFIEGNGTPANVNGMTVISSKWSLNGSNLMFEINGSFSKNVAAYQNICTFVIPQWISNKLETEIQNLLDISRCELVLTSGDVKPLYFIIYKNDNSIVFNLGVSVTPDSNSVYFKIRYNTIIDYNKGV